MSDQIVKEPEGISFYSIRTGETHYCKLEPTIAAYINSSDMGINASRGQDYGWRLAPEWVKKVRAFKRDATQMSILTSKNGGQKPTLVQILYYMYGEQLQAFFEAQEDNENPYEEAYAQAIAKGGVVADASTEPELPAALADFRSTVIDDDDDDITDLIDDVIAEDEPTNVGVDLAQKGKDESVETTVKNEGEKDTTPKSDSKSSVKK